MAHEVLDMAERAPGGGLAKVTAGGHTPSLGEARVTADAFGGRGAVVVWAAIGAAWTLSALAGWIWWIGSSNFKPMEKGPDAIPPANLAFIYGYQALAVGMLLYLSYRLIVKPMQREGRLSLDGMLLIGGTLAFFIDPMINYFHPDTFAWNAYAVNVGSWGNAFPWAQPNHAYGEALLWAWPDYIVFGLLGAIAGCGVLNFLKERYPRMSMPAALTISWVVLFSGGTVFELIRVWFELYSYARTISVLTLWPGKTYQWPVYESVFTASAVSVFVYLRWSWLTKGRSFLDSGLAELRLTARAKHGVLLLATIGFVTAVWAAFWFFPWAFTSVFADSIAHLPSYMTPVK